MCHSVELHNFAVNNVVGTCKSYTEVENDFKEFLIDLGFPESIDVGTELDKALADAEVLMCSRCNWWVNQYEISWNYDDVCTDCEPEEE